MKCVLVLVCLVSCFVAVLSGQDKVTECEKRSHSSFNAAQKQQLCSTRGQNSIGPAVCASVAKNMLHFKFDDILELCRDSVSASPAQCVNKLDAGLRSKYGSALCIGADSTLPAECFKELTSLKGSNDKIKPEAVVDFCKRLEDRAPLLCMHSVSSTALLPASQALALCNDSVGSGDSSSQSYYNNVAASCIFDMRYNVNPSLGLSANDVVKFCVETNPSVYIESEEELQRYQGPAVVHSVPAACYEAATDLKTSPDATANSHLLTVKQRLALCSNAPVVEGPINCTVLAQQNGRDPSSKLRPDDLAALCHGSTGVGPAECYLGSKGLGTIEERIQLCNGAENAGPAKCYRRAAMNVFKSDARSRSLLCVNADAEDPAVCAAEAPLYLNTNEKIQVCSNAPFSKGSHPIKCLQSVQTASRSFENAPKKALGYPVENLIQQSERTSRELMLQMCSFSLSVDPLASAECYKSVPNSLNHDDAVRMCTNVSSTEIIQHMQLCHRILPRDWQSAEASTLCESTVSRVQTEAAVKCAVDAVKFTFPKMTPMDAALLCASETAAGSVLACAKEVAKTSSAASGAGYLITPQSLIGACAKAADKAPGVCLRELTAHSPSKFVFDAAVPARLCKTPDPAAIVVCLEGLKKRLVTVDDVDLCLAEKRVLKSVRVARILTEDNDIEIMSGRRFSVWFDLFDQWGGRFLDVNRELMFSSSINANNPQGAVLWGMQTNYSANGQLQLNSLVISQPGSLDFKLSYRDVSTAVSSADVGGGGGGPSAHTSSNAEFSRKDLVHLETFKLKVKEDPVVANAAPCIYVFQQSFCPAEVPEADWIAEFPKIRTYASSRDYLRNIECQEAMQVWHVDAWLSPDGSMWSEYRLGVDAIWTGVGMPRVEMSYTERLDLPSSAADTPPAEDSGSSSSEGRKKRSTSKKADRESQKALRRSYYRKSLQWHPDRWAGMPIYAMAVQGAFELINEAYNALAQSGPGGGSAADSGSAD